MRPSSFPERVRRRLHQASDDQHDAIAMQALATLPGRFLPWTPYTMRPSTILAVLTDIEVNDRVSIVECGSGNSTVYAARLLAQRGAGHVISIDDDESWAGRTRAALSCEGLDEWATVVAAPLAGGWYDTTLIPEIPSVDLLVVDGPPANTAKTQHARLPALDFFKDRLTPAATVILDDARRPGEAEVVDRWRAGTKRTFQMQRGGYAVSAPHYA